MYKSIDVDLPPAQLQQLLQSKDKALLRNELLAVIDSAASCQVYQITFAEAGESGKLMPRQIFWEDNFSHPFAKEGRNPTRFTSHEFMSIASPGEDLKLFIPVKEVFHITHSNPADRQ